MSNKIDIHNNKPQPTKVLNILPFGKAWLGFFPLILVAVATAAATVVESMKGSDAARLLVYNSVWYFLLWLLTAVGGLWLILKKRMWRRPALLLLHVSFLVILLGATITHFAGKKGFVHVREKEAVNQFWIRTDDGQFLTNETLPFFICLKSFQVMFDDGEDTPSDYISEVILATKKGEIPTTISMNNIGRFEGFRIYQTSYDDDLHGSVLTVSYDPWGTAVTYLGYALLALGMIWSSLRQSRQTRELSSNTSNVNATGTTDGRTTLDKTDSHNNKTQPTKVSNTLPFGKAWLGFAVLLASYMVIAIAAHPLMPVLRSPMLFIHVSVICISYVLLIVSFVHRELLRLAVYMLAAGIFLGAIWANISWGTYWSWDPKESWALVTLIIYSLPLHSQSLPWFRSQKHYRIYSILSLLSLLMTYFGVNYILGGMHSYMG